MPTKQITGLGRGGIIKDLPSVILPESSFTDGRNVRFDNESVETITGETVYRTIAAMTPEYGFHWARPDQGYNVFLKDGSAIRVDAAGNESGYLLNSGLAKYSNSQWNYCYFNGGYAVVINNGKSTPLYMLYGDPVADSSLQEIPGWNYYAGLTVTAKVIKPLGYSLVAANLTLVDGAVITNAPSTIRVSVQAATGQFPYTWEPGTTTDTADELEINATSPILDMGELRGNMYIYSSDNIHVLTINSGVTRVQPYATGNGILNTNCFAEFDGKHFVVDKNDIYIHSGSGGIQSVADMRMRDYFFNNLNPDAYDKVIVKKNSRNDEIWICYPKGVSTTCNEALIYQYRSNTWTIRDLPNIISLFEAPLNQSNSFLYPKQKIHMTLGTSSVLQGDDGYQMWDGSSLIGYTSYVSREKLNTGDTLGTVLMKSITPVFDKVPVDAAIEFTVSGQNTYAAAADFLNPSDTYQFLPSNLGSQGYKVDLRTNGRLINYKISSTDYWRLALVGVEIISSDRR